MKLHSPCYGETNPNWRGGKRIDKDGYIHIYKPEHRDADANDCVLEHRLKYEEYHKCCLLKWTVIHHNNGDKTDQSKQNLVAMSQSLHASIEMKKDMSSRKCFFCGNDKIYLHRHKNGKAYPQWYNIEGRITCCKCYSRFLNE